jgi:hypothetical protein
MGDLTHIEYFVKKTMLRKVSSDVAQLSFQIIKWLFHHYVEVVYMDSQRSVEQNPPA